MRWQTRFVVVSLRMRPYAPSVLWRIPAALLLSCLGACAGDSDPHSILELQLVGEVPSGGELRAVIVWADRSAGGRGLEASDDAHLSRSGSTELPIRSLPMDLAEANVDPVDGPIAMGSILAYLDGDGDQRFAFTAASDSAFADRVVGWVPGLRMIYALNPQQDSVLDRGLSLHTLREDGLAPRPDGGALLVHIFGAPESACLGLSPPPWSLPSAVSDAVEAIDPGLGSRWPYPLGVPPCPDNELPDDWWRIECADGDGHRVTSLVWPTDPDMADRCGWLASYCSVEWRAGRAPPEAPSCE